MHGVFVNGRSSTNRPKTKKALKEAVEANEQVHLQATSVFGNEYDGPLSNAPVGTYTIVGPDPYTARTWYANIVKTDKGVKVK